MDSSMDPIEKMNHERCERISKLEREVMDPYRNHEMAVNSACGALKLMTCERPSPSISLVLNEMERLRHADALISGIIQHDKWYEAPIVIRQAITRYRAGESPWPE